MEADTCMMCIVFSSGHPTLFSLIQTVQCKGFQYNLQPMQYAIAPDSSSWLYYRVLMADIEGSVHQHFTLMHVDACWNLSFMIYMPVDHFFTLPQQGLRRVCLYGF